MQASVIAPSRVFRLRAKSAAALACLILWAEAPAWGQKAYDDPATPEGWAWSQIKQGKDVNFDERCPAVPKPFFWRDNNTQVDLRCRSLPASFLVNILTHAQLRDQVPSRGLTVVGALIEGRIDFVNAKLSHALEIRASRLEGDLILDSAQTDSEISITDSHLLGELDAKDMRSKMSLILSGSTIEKSVSLHSARLDGRVDFGRATFKSELQADAVQVQHLSLSAGTFHDVSLVAARIVDTLNGINATVNGPLNADSLHAGRILLTSRDGGQASFQAVRLASAVVAGQVSLVGARFAGALNMNSLSAGHLIMGSTKANQATFRNVNLVGARIRGNVEMDGSAFNGLLDAHAMSVGGTLFMGLTDTDKAKYDVPGKTSFKSVDLHLVKVVGHINMEDATFEEELTANSLEVGGDLLMCNIKSKRKISLAFSRIAGVLDARGASLVSLDLQGASISADLKLGKHEKGQGMDWGVQQDGDLNLKNARVTNLDDVADAWPAPGHLHVEGFTFSRLGQYRDPWWWDYKWIRHDKKYTPGPYEQLATAFAAAGNRSAADDIRFRGRTREREEAWRQGHWVEGVVLVFLEFVAGFGIGGYTFRVVYWVAGISLLGAVYLWYRVKEARKRGRLWCFGASLSRLLPVVEINKEFSDFFNDPLRDRLTGRQTAIFSGIAMLGWLLGAILVAAVAGLTQKG
jgi:hypothetical protein